MSTTQVRAGREEIFSLLFSAGSRGAAGREAATAAVGWAETLEQLHLTDCAGGSLEAFMVLALLTGVTVV